MKNNYKNQNCCHNCKHVFIKSEYDEGDDYYCHEDKSERPPCGSVFMKEAFLWDEKDKRTSKKERMERWDKWEKWKTKREVKSFGICDKWEAK